MAFAGTHLGCRRQIQHLIDSITQCHRHRHNARTKTCSHPRPVQPRQNAKGRQIRRRPRQ